MTGRPLGVVLSMGVVTATAAAAQAACRYRCARHAALPALARQVLDLAW